MQQGVLEPKQRAAHALPLGQRAGRPAWRRLHHTLTARVHDGAAEARTDATEQDGLSWSASEPGHLAHGPPQEQQQQQHGQRQKQSRKQPQHQKQTQQQQQQQQQQRPMQKQQGTSQKPTLQQLGGPAGMRQRQHSSPPHNKKANSNAQPGRSTWQPAGRQPRRTGAAAAAPTPYDEAQQRVREILAAADVNNPAAVAEQLPDTVNDLTITLQLLATSPRPTQQAAYRQYDVAVQQLAAAVIDKYKRLLLRLAPFQPPQQQQQQPEQPGTQQQQQQQLAAALASLPATKLAAAAFSLGVLRLYDRPLVEALESASLQLLHRNAFNPNQLGQLVQGFVYLDHQLNPEWHSSFLKCTRKHLDSMQGAQLASIAVWLLSCGMCGSSHAAAASKLGLMLRAADPSMRGLESAPPPSAVAAAAAVMGAAGAAGSSSVAAGGCVQLQLQPDAAWVQLYLAAVASQARRLKPLQLVQVLQACAGVWLQQSPPQQGSPAAAGAGGALSLFVQQPTSTSAGSGSIPVSLDGVAAALQDSARRAFRRSAPHSRHQQQQQQQQAVQQGRSSRGRSSSEPGCGSRGSGDAYGSTRGSISTTASSTDSSWVLALVAAVQQQLPELSMAHLAAALPPLLLLTQCPWPQQLQQPLLLQVKVQLPSSAGRDLVAVLQAVAHLAGPEALLAAEQEWCDAVLMQLHAQLPTLGPSELAGAVHAVALLQVRPYKAWTYELCHRLRVDAMAMSAAEVLAVMQGLAAVGIQLDPEVLHVYVLQIKRWMGSLTAEQLGGLVTALRAMYPRALPGRTVQQLVEGLQRRQQFLMLQARKGQRSLWM